MPGFTLMLFEHAERRTVNPSEVAIRGADMNQGSEHQAPRILVTGATGLIGRHVVRRLLEEHAQVRILTREAGRVPAAWAGQVQVVMGDITDRGAVDRAAAGTDIVHHLAGEIRRPERFHVTNVDGTRQVVEACRAHGVRALVHYSSVGVIGPVRGRVDESAPCHPVNAYERSKLEGETFARRLGDTLGIPVVVLRPTNVFGESRADSMLQWCMAIRRGWFRRIGKGGVANYVYAGDIADAGIDLSRRQDAAGGVFIVSDPTSMDEFVDMIAEAIGGAIPPGRIPVPVALALASAAEFAARLVGRPVIPLTRARVQALATTALYSPDRLRGLGIAPRIGLREGLRRTTAWYRAQGLL